MAAEVLCRAVIASASPRIRPPSRGKGDLPTRIIIATVIAIAGGMALIVMQPWELLKANTPAGGDMGAHVLIPAFIRDELLPSGRILGWSNDWYAGFPVLSFYFPLPALTIVALDVVLPYGVAFKMVTVAGLVALPAASYYFARQMGFARPVALVGGVAGFTFVFMESFSIFGANTLSTLAGEYSFSWSFALGLVYLGMVTRNVREGRGFTIDAGVLLALTALSHIITTVIMVIASVPLLIRKRSVSTLTGAWALGFALTGFWSVPLLMRFRELTTDMEWQPVQGIGNVFPRELIPITVLAVIGILWSSARRKMISPALALAIVPVAGYYLIEYVGYTKLYNARLLPFWYYAVFLFAGLGVGLAIHTVARRMHLGRPALVAASGGAAIVFLVAAGFGVQRAPLWAQWNYQGYEGKPAAPEYFGLMDAIDTLPPGRIMWEANNDLNKYGTPMALMLTGYWSDGHPSMEGLLFESSLTTPFHFLNASEVSQRPSNPIPGLNYRRMDFDRALPHLALYDVAYYVSFTEEATRGAQAAGLQIIAEPEPFTIFALPEASLVDVATVEPVVWAGGGFKDMALDWYDDVGGLHRWVVDEGPEDWRTITTLDAARVRTPIAASGAVSDVEIDHHRISFKTTAIGVPHMVKVSYFPNWTAHGAEGPYRAAPSLMVVVPTDEEVVLTFDRQLAENGGMLLTAVALTGLGAVALVRRRRKIRRRAEMFG